MKEALFALPGIGLAILCWGMYGPAMHKGQVALSGDRLKPLICVGAAYFIVAIIVQVIILSMNGQLGSGWRFSGVGWSMTAGAAGALGALGIILALTAGGKPIYVMPLVFGGAPIINVFTSMFFAKIPGRNVSPFFYSGMILVAIGAAMVLVFQPGHGNSHADKEGAKQPVTASKETADQNSVQPGQEAT